MKRIQRLICAALIGSVAQGLQASSSGPMVGAAGVPEGGGFAAEMTCNACHNDLPLNADDQGKIELLGVPERYTPACSYELTLRISHPQATRWGFELTAIDAATYRMAGDLTPLPNDKTVQRITGGSGDRVYVTHGASGRATGVGQHGSHAWKFLWTAPAGTGGDVLFFSAVNAANGDGSNFGDRIYTRSPQPAAVSKAPAQQQGAPACPVAGGTAR